MKIILTTSLAGPTLSGMPGEEIDLDDETARRFLDRGLAVLPETSEAPDSKPAPRKKKTSTAGRKRKPAES